MYYHLYRNVFSLQLLSAIQAETKEEYLPRAELDSADTSKPETVTRKESKRSP